ncbi:glycosyltransferase family 8 protein [Patellaria atrata CBS 101060]|uniref:Glycosyltransferase family 8 protein n=1 Tax=Patellaria atrata CBS 101060 TaxID=1346257 RepID=A0A9P4SBR1_9PEZI|nr:glycosyltransferase family 8 protein [Patellaria atrata CBS 101060]
MSKSTRNAYCTFLSSPLPSNVEDTEFLATRILAYQLLHDPTTKSPSKLPLVVLVTKDVEQSKRNLLTADGATVLEVTPFLTSSTPSSASDLTKLRAFQLTQFDKVLYLAPSTLLTQPLDAVFADPATAEYAALTPETEPPPQSNTQAPSSYVFAASATTGNMLDPGFVVFKPAEGLFRHYIAVLGASERGFDTAEALWREVHAQKSNMPWNRLAGEWNGEVLKEGVRSVRVEGRGSGEVREVWGRVRGRMEGYWIRAEE